VRVSTAFNRMLAIPGATVAGVAFTPAGVVLTLRRRATKLRCPACGQATRATYDRSTRRWRHLDLGASRLYLEAEIRRLRCTRCDRVLTEEVPWARPGARHTKDFEDVVAFLAQRADKTTVAKLLRCSWEAVAHIVARVVATTIDDARLDHLYRIGVDDVSYRKGHRYLTVVADHDRDGAVVWAAEGRDAATLRRFFDDLGPERTARLEAISADMGAGYAKAIADATKAGVLTARTCVDPFHVVKLANEAIDACRRWAWNQARRSGQGMAAWVKRTRWALVKDPGHLSTSQRLVLEELRRSRSVLYRAWALKEALRDVYRLRSFGAAHQFLDRWLSWACRCRIPSFVKLSRTIREHRDGILAAVELGLSNSKLEGLNSKIRLINHRGYGHHTAAAVIAMIYLCCGGITVRLPTER
jgi:transposase